jgi:hypothetical protein
MKKIMLLLLFIPMIGFSQLIKTKEIIEAKKPTKDNIEQNEVWLNMYDAFYRIRFEQNPVGVKHLFETLKSVLEVNKLDINNPFLDKSLLASYAKNTDDYGTLNTSIIAGDAEIEKYWIGNNETTGRIIITLNKKEYSILFK